MVNTRCCYIVIVLVLSVSQIPTGLEGKYRRPRKLGEDRATQVLSAGRNATSQCDELAPSWSIELRDGEPKVTLNGFAAESKELGTFPVRLLRIRKTYKKSGAYPPLPDVLVGLLEIDESGEVVGMTEYISGVLVSDGPYETRPSFLKKSSDSKSEIKSIHVSCVSNPDIDLSGVRGWQKAGDESFAVVLTDHKTFLVDPTTSGILLEYPGETSFVAISRDSEKAAVVIVAYGTEGRGGPPAPMPKSFKIVIFGSAGDLLFETPSTSSHYYYPYLTPNGKYLIVGKIADPDVVPYETTYRLVILNTEDGSETIVNDLPFGVSFFSGDGRYMAYNNMKANTIWYYDMSDPTNPLLLWEFAEDILISSIAVSEHGDYIAVDARNRRENPQKSLFVLDSKMEKIGKCTNPGINASLGVMFVGDFLFKGIKNHPVPFYANFENTKRIDLFSLSQRSDSQ